MEKVAYNEVELAKRWGISPKTLQRWRSEGRGPRYLKLSKRVVYPVDEIEAYEHDALYASTWQKADDVIPPSSDQWMSARQIAYATGMPMYVLTHPQVREALGIPHTKIGKLIRFRLAEVMAWGRRWSAESEIAETEQPIDDHRRTLQHPALVRTFLNNACGLLRKHAESCGLTMLHQHHMKPGAKAPFALLQQNI